MSDLRERLIAADSFRDALSAYRADLAIPVVAEWLRAEAVATVAMRAAGRVTEEYAARRSMVPPSEDNIALAVLATLADALTQKEPTP